MANETKKTEQTQSESKALKLPLALTVDWSEKHTGSRDFYHDTARRYGFGDFRNDAFQPPLDLGGLSDAQRAALEEKASAKK